MKRIHVHRGADRRTEETGLPPSRRLERRRTVEPRQLEIHYATFAEWHQARMAFMNTHPSSLHCPESTLKKPVKTCQPNGLPATYACISSHRDRRAVCKVNQTVQAHRQPAHHVEETLMETETLLFVETLGVILPYALAGACHWLAASLKTRRMAH